MSSDFTVGISQNEYLAEGAGGVNAIGTVTSPDTGVAAPVDNQGSAEIIIIDCSGSTRPPRTKIEQARAAAVDVIRDGVAFAVIAGTNKAPASGCRCATATGPVAVPGRSSPCRHRPPADAGRRGGAARGRRGCRWPGRQ
jgi:hypothetical protein